MLKTANEVCKTMYSKISKIEKYAFISAIVCGLAAHGYMFANKLSFHDDIGDIWGVGLTLASERWFLEVIKRFCATFSINASSAWYNGLISLLFLSVSAAVVVRILDVKEELNAILISGIMVVFPTVAATFAYMFTAPAYCFAVLLICISAYLITQNKLFNVFFGGILMSVSLGIYQAYIGVYTSLAVIVLIQKILNKKEEFRIILKSIASYMAGGTLGIVLYLVMNKVMGIIFNQKSYYAEKDLRLFFDAIISAYKNFYNIFKHNFYGINIYLGIRSVLSIFFVVTVIVFAYRILFEKVEWKNKLMGSIILILFPVAVNFMYIITLNDVTVHALMLYPLCAIFILPYVILQENAIEDTNESKKRKTVKSILSYVYSIGVLVVICLFIKVDNVAYQHCSFVQEQVQTYYADLIGRIQSCDEYDGDLPVAFVNIEKMDDASMTIEERFRVSLTALEFDMYEVISDYTHKQYLALHCGYSPNYVDNNELREIKEKDTVQEMPCYPKDGSVKIVDGVVVVKFADEDLKE